MINIKIFSQDDFLICGKDFEEQLSNLSYIDILIEENEKCILKIFPLNNLRTSIPFCLCVSFDNGNLVCNNNNVKVFNFISHYEIIIFPLYVCSNYKCESQTLISNKTSCKVNVWENKINFETKQYSNSYNISLSEPIFKTSNGNVIVIGKQKNSFACCVYTIKTNSVEAFYGEQIQFSENKLKILTDGKTCFGHKILSTYEFSIDGPTKTNAELYTKNVIRQNYPKEVIPYLFLESLKVGDENRAKSHLADNLLNTKIQTFENYFGNFKYIYVSSVSPLIYQLYYENSGKKFEFILLDNCISDINEI